MRKSNTLLTSKNYLNAFRRSKNTLKQIKYFEQEENINFETSLKNILRLNSFQFQMS